MKGWGPKSSARPSKFRKPNFWMGNPGIFAGISLGPEKLEKKSVCSFFGP